MRYTRSVTPGELIRTVRQRGGLTQAELARRAGTSQPVVSAYEHGRRDPTIGTLRRLVAAGGERLVVDTTGFTRADVSMAGMNGAGMNGGPPPAADDTERGRRLVDVLLLADAIPTRRRAPELCAPRLVSS